jgi:hypothetical protein
VDAHDDISVNNQDFHIFIPLFDQSLYGIDIKAFFIRGEIYKLTQRVGLATTLEVVDFYEDCQCEGSC